MLGMKVKDIAAMEGITPSQAGKSIHAALRRPVSYTHLDVYKRQGILPRMIRILQLSAMD